MPPLKLAMPALTAVVPKLLGAEIEGVRWARKTLGHGKLKRNVEMSYLPLGTRILRFLVMVTASQAHLLNPQGDIQLGRNCPFPPIGTREGGTT